MNSTIRTAIAISVSILGVSSAQATGPKAIPYAKISGLITKQCAYCHNATRHPEAVDLSSYKALMKSGEKGSIVSAGHPEKSKLIAYIDGTKEPRMPFKKAPLSKADIKAISDWVAAGAKG